MTESTPTDPTSVAVAQTTKHSDRTPQPLTLPMLLLKTTLLALGIFFVMVVLSLLGVAIYGWNQYQKFLTAAALTHEEVMDLYAQTNTAQVKAASGKTVFLVLGADTVANKTAPPLTDTILLAAVDPEDASIAMMSLPRDLWSDEYQTKLNSLYYYGMERYPERPEQFVEEVIEDLTSVAIDYTVVVSLSHVEELISLLDGVEINIPEGFTDEKFPREDIDLSLPRADEELYETVVFEPGEQRLNSKRALQYMRSRQSPGDTGTDDHRSLRQQLVLTALAQQLSVRDLLGSPTLSGSLVKWYRTHFEHALPIPEMAALALSLSPQANSVTLEQNTLSLYPDDELGVIDNPPLSSRYQNQWVYRVRDREALQQFVRGILLEPVNQ